MSTETSITDVQELCALLQCLGFTVKSLDTSDANHSQDAGSRTVVVNCQSSGLHVVLESPAVNNCSCPAAEQNSGFWQISGVAGGKQHDKEAGSTLLRSIPKQYRDRISRELRDMVLRIKALHESDAPIHSTINKSASMIDLASKSSLIELSKEGNKSASILELGTPEKRNQLLKAETPTRFRSLDTLTAAKDNEPQNLLKKQYTVPDPEDNNNKITMCRRQSTYTVCSSPGSVRRRNKTSSPIQPPQNNLLENLIEAEKAAESLHTKLTVVIRELMEEKHDSSISSMLDVSKISLLKTETSKAQFASSPNLSGIGALRDDLTKSRLKRFESASTSNLARSTPEPETKSKLRRISPNIFKLKKDGGVKDGRVDGRSKLQNLFRPKIVTPVRSGRPAEASPSPSFSSASKKKFSHIKSTIPRPTPKKE